MARSGMRSWIRKVAACEPGGCGAQPGQPCIAYVPKRGKTTGKPTADVHAARWRTFRAGQRKRVTEREEKAMRPKVKCPECGRDTSGRAAEGGIILRPHVKALKGTKESGFGPAIPCPGAGQFVSTEEKVMTEISDDEAAEALWASSEAGRAAVSAAMARAESMGFGDVPSYVIGAACWEGHRAEQTEGAAGHDHRWQPLSVQHHDPVPPGRPHMHTAALLRCRECGVPEAVMLPGTWTLADLAGDGIQP